MKKRTAVKLSRTTFRTSRLLDFCSRKELIAQTGHQPDEWPLVILKELVDNALDACEDAGIAPKVTVKVDAAGIEVQDNGPGLPASTVEGVLDFSVRVSSREAYVSPTRGAQGNALKALVAMPFVLDGERGRVEIATKQADHTICLEVDRIRQTPVVDHRRRKGTRRTGTAVRVCWPDSASSKLTERKAHFLQFADDYTFLNPHLTLRVQWFDDNPVVVKATDRKWRKWMPSNPTDPHWYGQEHFDRLASAHIAHDADHGADRSIREFISEFRGMSGTAKQKAVLAETGLARCNVSDLTNGKGLDGETTQKLLRAIQDATKPVKPAALGVIGKDHLRTRFEALGCEMDSFQYKKAADFHDGIPFEIETAFGWCESLRKRRLVTGVNWSPGIVNPFRELGTLGDSLDTILSRQWVYRTDPVILVLHVACPRVEYADRGKSSVVVEGGDDEG